MFTCESMSPYVSKVYCSYEMAYIRHVAYWNTNQLLVTIKGSRDIYPCRKDKTVWLGETQDKRIGFFQSKYVEELLGYDIMDGTWELCNYLNIFNLMIFLGVKGGFGRLRHVTTRSNTLKAITHYFLVQ